jgi:hypothetical protein
MDRERKGGPSIPSRSETLYSEPEMTFLILLIVLVVIRNLAELLATSLGASDFWWAYNPQISWIICVVMFGIYAIIRPAKAPAIGMSLVTILAVILADYFIEAVTNLIRHPDHDWKVMLIGGAFFFVYSCFAVQLCFLPSCYRH